MQKHQIWVCVDQCCRHVLLIIERRGSSVPSHFVLSPLHFRGAALVLDSISMYLDSLVLKEDCALRDAFLSTSPMRNDSRCAQPLRPSGGGCYTLDKRMCRESSELVLEDSDRALVLLVDRCGVDARAVSWNVVVVAPMVVC